MSRNNTRLRVVDLVIFAMLGALMTVLDLCMNILPNVHLGGMLIVTFTVVYRAKALFPIYIYVVLIGLIEGLGLWWLPYLYIWAILWGVTMLLPRRMPTGVAAVVYALVCGLHGFAFGFLWLPSQMLLLHMSFEQALAWWAAGFLTADVPHGIGNLLAGALVVPLAALIRRLDKATRRGQRTGTPTRRTPPADPAP